MVDFVQNTALVTAPGDGWLSAIGSSQVSLSATEWVVRGTGLYADWTFKLVAAGGYTTEAGNPYPFGVLTTIEARTPQGALAASIDMSGATVAPVQLQSLVGQLFSGDNHFTGSAGDDVLWTGAGNDTVAAGSGNDIIYGVSGTDSINGGAGDDTITASGGTVDGGTGDDRLLWSDATTTLRIGTGPGAVLVTNVERIEGQNLDASTSTTGQALFGSREGDALSGGAGADTITGGWGYDTLKGGLGNDILDGSDPVDTYPMLFGGQIHYFTVVDSAWDTVSFAGLDRGVRVDLSVTGPQDTGAGLKTILNFEIIEGTSFADTLSGSTDSDVIRGGAGDDLLAGGAGSDSLDGGEGVDRVDYSGNDAAVQVVLAGAATSSSADSLISIEGVIGSQFGDTLTATDGLGLGAFLAGNGGADSLVGASFGDVLHGGLGNDVMTGGGGADKFVLQTDGSTDTVTDFNVGQDILLVLDGSGNLLSGTSGLLTLNRTSGQLTWDADSDAGAQAPVTVGFLQGAGTLTKANLAAGFEPSALRTLNADGARTDVVLDWGNQSFNTATTTYDSSGALKSYEVRYDSGGWSLRTNDLGNLAPDWATVVAEYDPGGQLFAYSVYHDDGSRTLWLYDTNNSKTYSRVLEEYDGQSRLTQQSAALDDGTAWERHIDAADTQPWAYYIDNYANGRLLNHTLYNANGTVFAG